MGRDTTQWLVVRDDDEHVIVNVSPPRGDASQSFDAAAAAVREAAMMLPSVESVRVMFEGGRRATAGRGYRVFRLDEFRKFRLDAIEEN